MASTYRIFILDDFDWNHAYSKKGDILERIRYAAPSGKCLAVESEIPNAIILDSGTSMPSSVHQWLRLALVPFDVMYYQQDGQSEIVRWES